MKRSVKAVLSLYILFAVLFSFQRYLHFSVDGDLPAIVLAHHSYRTVTEDPFGMNVLLRDSVYPAPNRYFAHQSMSLYFKNAPLFFQFFVSPINSIYYACAFAKTAIEFFLIYLLAVGITGKRRLLDPDVLLAASLVTPLFQVYGYNASIGIIDSSVTYAFFYAHALSLVLLFFLPFFLAWFYDFRIRKTLIVLLLLLAVVLSFHGPLNSALILIICPVVMLAWFSKSFQSPGDVPFRSRTVNSLKQIPSELALVFGSACLIALYSLYIGKNNSENLWDSLPLLERYARLPGGLWNQYTKKLAMPLLLAMIGMNSLLIRKNMPEQKARKLFILLKWIGILSAIYILALPLGGYRAYRPNIIRMDSVMPVTLALFFYYGLTTFHILKELPFKSRKYYIAALLLFSAVFIYADKEIRKQNTCEKDALEKISRSPDKIVFLDNDCSVLAWGKSTDYRDSEVKTDLLQRWGVLKEKKFFYQK